MGLGLRTWEAIFCLMSLDYSLLYCLCFEGRARVMMGSRLEKPSPSQHNHHNTIRHTSILENLSLHAQGYDSYSTLFRQRTMGTPFGVLEGITYIKRKHSRSKTVGQFQLQFCFLKTDLILRFPRTFRHLKNGPLKVSTVKSG